LKLDFESVFKQHALNLKAVQVKCPVKYCSKDAIYTLIQQTWSLSSVLSRFLFKVLKGKDRIYVIQVRVSLKLRCNL